MRICHLTTVHDWSDTRIFVKMCQSASSDGFQVDLIAPVAREHPVTDSKGVTVHAMRKYRSRVLRASLGTLRAIRRAMGISATVYHIHDPELLPAVIALRISHHRVVFDFHEEFAMQVKSKEFLRPWQRRVVSRLARCWELMLCRGAWKVVTATRGIRDRLPSRRSDAIVVYNYPSLDEFPAPSTMPFGRRPRTAYYVGGVTRIRGCYEMIRAAQILASTRSGNHDRHRRPARERASRE